MYDQQMPTDAYARDEHDDTQSPQPPITYGSPPAPGPGMWFPMGFAMALLRSYFGAEGGDQRAQTPPPVAAVPYEGGAQQGSAPPRPSGSEGGFVMPGGPSLIPRGTAARYAGTVLNTQQYSGHPAPVRRP